HQSYGTGRRGGGGKPGGPGGCTVRHPLMKAARPTITASRTLRRNFMIFPFFIKVTPYCSHCKSRTKIQGRIFSFSSRVAAGQEFIHGPILFIKGVDGFFSDQSLTNAEAKELLCIQ